MLTQTASIFCQAKLWVANHRARFFANCPHASLRSIASLMILNMKIFSSKQSTLFSKPRLEREPEAILQCARKVISLLLPIYRGVDSEWIAI